MYVCMYVCMYVLYSIRNTRFSIQHAYVCTCLVTDSSMVDKRLLGMGLGDTSGAYKQHMNNVRS